MIFNLCLIGFDLHEVVPMISPVLVILTFIISQIIANYSRKNELRRSWYFKAYFDKSIDKVNDFFNECRLTTKKSLKKVKTIKDATAQQDYITKKLEDISDSQRDFKMQVLYPLMGAYPDVFRDITLILDSFYDVHSKVFDVYENDTDPFKIYLEEIANIKNNLMIFLAIPVLKSKQSRRLRKSLDEQNFGENGINFGKIFTLFITVIVLLTSYFIYRYTNIREDEKLTKRNALINSKPFVEKQLLSPSTAEFNENWSESVNLLNDTAAIVNSYVDSDNVYGTNIRTTFSCKIIFDPKSGKYSCEKLTFSNN